PASWTRRVIRPAASPARSQPAAARSPAERPSRATGCEKDRGGSGAVVETDESFRADLVPQGIGRRERGDWGGFGPAFFPHRFRCGPAGAASGPLELQEDGRGVAQLLFLIAGGH